MSNYPKDPKYLALVKHWKEKVIEAFLIEKVKDKIDIFMDTVMASTGISYVKKKKATRFSV